MNESEKDLFDVKQDNTQFLATLEEKAKELGDLERTIDELEEQVKQLRSRRHQIRTVEMIDLMDQSSLSSITYNGMVFEKDSELNGSFPKIGSDNYKDSVQYLLDSGNDDLLKIQLAADFQNGDYAMAMKIKEEIQKYCEPTLGYTVSSNDLKSIR